MSKPDGTEPPTHTAPKPRLLILAYSQVARDARILRQARALAEDFRVTVAGYGPDPFRGDDVLADVVWYEIEQDGSRPRFRTLRRRVFAWLSRFHSAFAHAYCRDVPEFRHGWFCAQSARFRVILCNDVATLPAGVAATKRNRQARILLDLHEYPTREASGGGFWRWEQKPFATGVLKRMAKRAHGTLTVAPSFAPLMRKEFRMRKPVIVRNAPDLVDLPPRGERDEETIRIIHHGGAIRGRDLGRLVDIVSLLEPRFVLHFMLVGDSDYIAELKAKADKECPGRISFEPPVKPSEISSYISRFDMGMMLLPPTCFNHVHALPNKFFDCIVAGLPVAVGPSVNLKKLIEENGTGWVAADYEPASMARLLNGIGRPEIEAGHHAALEMREHCHAGVEMEKLTALARKIARFPADREAMKPSAL